MGDVVHYEVQDGVAVITLDNPPVNGLGHAVRAGIVDALRRAERDAAVKAAVLIRSERAFSGGAQIREFTRPPLAPLLPDVNDAQDRFGKPLVAAIGGLRLGGGVEAAPARPHPPAGAGGRAGAR